MFISQAWLINNVYFPIPAVSSMMSILLHKYYLPVFCNRHSVIVIPGSNWVYSNYCNNFHPAILHTQNLPLPTMYHFSFCSSTLPSGYFFQKGNWVLRGRVQSNNFTVPAECDRLVSLGLQQTELSGAGFVITVRYWTFLNIFIEIRVGSWFKCFSNCCHLCR
jgi:hypothetical protein